MRATDHPGVRGMVATWLALTRQLFSPRTVEALAESGADVIKDTLFRLGASRPPENPEAGQTLPPLDPSCVRVSLREAVEEVFLRATEILNEDPTGCPSAATESRILDLFRGLGEEVLARALDLRIAAAEAELAPVQAEPGEWVKKYRRMLAAEGRWPPTAEDEEGGEGEPASKDQTGVLREGAFSSTVIAGKRDV